MWELYRTLDIAQFDQLTFESLGHLLIRTPHPRLYAAFHILYPKVQAKNGPVFLGLLVRGLRANDFFGFVKMVRKLS